MGEFRNNTVNSIDDDARGSYIGASQIKIDSIASQGEARRVGKIYARDAPIDSVVASEMARI